MIERLASEMDILLNKSLDIHLDFRKKDYTVDDLLRFLWKLNYSQDLHRLLKILDRLEPSIQNLKKDLSSIRDIQQRYRGY